MGADIQAHDEVNNRSLQFCEKLLNYFKKYPCVVPLQVIFIYVVHRNIPVFQTLKSRLKSDNEYILIVAAVFSLLLT